MKTNEILPHTWEREIYDASTLPLTICRTTRYLTAPSQPTGWECDINSLNVSHG